MDEHREQAVDIAGEPQLSLRPSDYFRRQCWISCEPDEPYIPRVLDFGEDRLLFASDYPHPDHKWRDTVEAVRALPIPDTVKQKVLWDNPIAFYDGRMSCPRARCRPFEIPRRPPARRPVTPLVTPGLRVWRDSRDRRGLDEVALRERGGGGSSAPA